MASIGYATLQVIPSLKGFNTRLRTTMGGPLSAAGADAGQKAGRSFQSAFAKFALGATAIAGVAALGKGFYDAAIESQKVTKQTEAVLKSMGNVAGVTAKDVSELSEALSLKSGVDDEVIQSAQNVLLTFGKVRNEVGKDNKVFDRATQAALDMSVALDQDLQGATLQVGKALNDPVKGMTALTRAGVSFTKEQKDTVKQLVETGRTLDAQKVILKELENQFGGSAAAQATAGDRLKVVWGNLQEQLGTYLVPVMEKVATWLAEHLPKAMAATEQFIKETLIPKLKELWEWFEINILPALTKVANFIREELLPRLVAIADWIVSNDSVLKGFAVVIGTVVAGAFLAWAASAAAAAAATLLALAPFIAVAALAVAVGAALFYAYDNWGWFKDGVDGALGVIAYGIEGLKLLYEWLTSVNGALKTFSEVAGFLGFGGNRGIDDEMDAFAAKVARSTASAPQGVLGSASRGATSNGWWSRIPRGDSGGIMPGPRGVHSLALVAGGETLIPTHKQNMLPLSGSRLGSGAGWEVSLAPGAENAAMAWLLRLVRINRGFGDGLRGAAA